MDVKQSLTNSRQRSGIYRVLTLFSKSAIHKKMERINYMKQCRWTSKSCWVKEIKRRSVHIVGFCAYEVEKWANVNCAARNQIASCPRVEQDRAFWGYWDRALSKPSELRVMHFLHVNYIPIKQKKKNSGGSAIHVHWWVCLHRHFQKPYISKLYRSEAKYKQGAVLEGGSGDQELEGSFVFFA